MCGIVGYAGYGDAKTFLLSALHDLEYRGYDSAGIAAIKGNGITTIKRAGRVSALEETINGQFGQATTGIGHTRWATHGAPTDTNAHPHLSYDGKVAIAHNGIIENHGRLRAKLEADGIEFASDTDSEVVAHLIARHMQAGDSLLSATKKASRRLKGLSVILAISADEPDAVVGIRIGYAGSLMLGKSGDGWILASNAAAMPRDVNEVVHVDHCEAVRISPDDAMIVDVAGKLVEKEPVKLLPGSRISEINEHAHFMHKEISEQAAAVQGAMRGRVDFSDMRIDIPELDMLPAKLDRIVLAGMGTSHFAGMAGARRIERLARIPTSIEYAGELADRDPVMGERDLLVAVTQSGETYDTLVAIEKAKSVGSTVAVVTANVHSEASRIADVAVDIGSGVEVAVPATKTFINTMLVLYMIGLQLGRDAGRLSDAEFERHIESIVSLPGAINRTLGQEAEIEALARERFDGVTNMLILGRGDLYPVALEGALKMKETAYIHAEGCSASEMKHGINALVEPSTPTIALVPKNGELRTKMLTSIYEVQSRSGEVIAVAHEGDIEVEAIADGLIPIASEDEEHSPFLMTIPLQQLAYHTALARGIDPDRPRNLAKTVTVA